MPEPALSGEPEKTQGGGAQSPSQGKAMSDMTEEDLTDRAVARWMQVSDPRLRQVMTALVRHLHAFVRDVEPTEAEWFAGIDWLTRIGQMSSDKRQEFILASDVLAVSMLVDAINHRLPSGATPSTIEGPFHISHSRRLENGENMAVDAPGVACFVAGRVNDLAGRPIAGATIDVWQTDGEGLYEAQRPGADQYMRAIYSTRPDGSYLIRTVAPIAYTIPMDGPVGALMRRTTISEYRPAHIHCCIEKSGFRPLVTHLFRQDDPYLETDPVFGVKAALITDFVLKPALSQAPDGSKPEQAFYEIYYDFVLEVV
jgi:hydroxyquinol 1,2-dioxygenase